MSAMAASAADAARRDSLVGGSVRRARTLWVPAGGRTVHEDPDRTLADVERDEVARMERLGASRAEAERLAARGIERGVAGQHCERMAAWRARREKEAERPRDEVTKQGRAGAVQRSEVGLEKPSRQFDIDRLCVLVLREPEISLAAASARLEIHRESLRWVVLAAKRRGLLEWGRAGRPRIGQGKYVLTEKGRQHASTLITHRMTENGPSAPRSSDPSASSAFSGSSEGGVA